MEDFFHAEHEYNIKKLDMYIPAAKIFQVLPSEENAIFLDSSLVNELGSLFHHRPQTLSEA